MTWTIAPYIPLTEIADRPVEYEWNDLDPLFYYREDRRFENRIAKICDRGVVGLSAGIAEWVAARWLKAAEPVLLPEVEAVWAGIIDWRYLRPAVAAPNAPKGAAWQGPERGPVCDAFYSLANVAGRAQRSASLVSHCAALAQLAMHVLPDATGFKEWRRAAIERLAALYPRHADDRLGPPIPREALDPKSAFQTEMAKGLLARFLQGLDYAHNSFLRSPEEMKQQGFEGTPYTLGTD
jgi:hypothetical protein